MNNDMLKFRVWDKKYNTYWYNVRISSDGSHAIYVTPDKVDYITAPSWMNFDNDSTMFVIEQCSGKRDMHCNLIYAGDIVKCKQYDCYIIGFVIQSEYNSQWQVLGKDLIHDKIYTEISTLMQPSYLEIVGNIHTTTQYKCFENFTTEYLKNM